MASNPPGGFVPPPNASVRRATPEEQAEPSGFVPPPAAVRRREAPRSPGLSEQAGQFARSATGEAVQTGTMLSGALAGAGVGAVTGAAVSGPFAPAGAVVGAGVGFVAGGFFGDSAGAELRKRLARIVSPELNVDTPLGELPLSGGALVAERGDAPEGLRGAEFAGEVFGGSVPFAAAPFAALRAGLPSVGGRWLDGVMRFARDAPARFAFTEGAAAGQAAVAGGLAMEATDNELWAAGAAAAGGVLSAPAAFSLLWTQGGATFRRLTARFSEGARQTEAGRLLHQAFDAFGEDPQVAMRMLAQSDPDGIYTTSAQRLDSRAMVAMEARLSARSDVFRQQVAGIGREALETLEGALRATGDPQALRAAAEVRRLRYETTLSARINLAREEASEALTQLRGAADDVSRMELSVRARNILDEALEDARAIERELHGRYARDLEVTADSLFDRYDALRGDMLPEERMPQVLEGAIRRMRGEAEEGVAPELAAEMLAVFGRAGDEVDGASTALLTSGELSRFRSRALALARNASNAGNPDEARIYGALADAALDDLDRAFATAGDEAYDAARAFSRALNDTFTRSFAGQARATNRFGDRTAPEVLLREATAVGEELAALRLRDLERATRFLPDQGLGTLDQWQVMMQAQEQYLRLAVVRSRGEDGQLRPAALRKFMDDNPEVLDRFPALAADMRAALTSRERLDRLANATSRAGPAVEQRAAFARLLRVDQPSTAISQAAMSANPDSRLTAMARFAVRAGPEAAAGMNSAAIDAALRAGGVQRGGFNPARVRQALFSPTAKGQSSLMDILVEQGVVTGTEAARQRTVLDRMERVHTAMTTGAGVQDLLQNPDALTDLLLRVGGARLGVMAAQGADLGSTLIAAQRGSVFLRNMFDKVPQQKVATLLEQAMVDPAFGAMLLERYANRTPRGQLEHFARLHAYMVQSSLMPFSDDDGVVSNLVGPILLGEGSE